MKNELAKVKGLEDIPEAAINIANRRHMAQGIHAVIGAIAICVITAVFWVFGVVREPFFFPIVLSLAIGVCAYGMMFFASSIMAPEWTGIDKFRKFFSEHQ